MSNTSNLDLERPDKGDAEWHTSLNSNMLKLDTGYGNNVATIADLPEMYIETGTFNFTTGDTITLPVEVDATNEYNVEITPTSRAGAIGDIYVTKTTTNFVVKCAENNTTDTFEATIYYIGDIASYGGSIYRRWYVSPDAGITDHGDDTDTGSFAWVLDQIGATSATVELPGNKTYTITTATVVPDNVNIIPQKGAVFGGAGTLTFDNSYQIDAKPNQQIFGSSITVVFTNKGTVSVGWFGALGDDSNDDTAEIQAAIVAGLSTSGGRVFFPAGTYKLTSALQFLQYDGFIIAGESRLGTVFKQYTINTPIFQFTKELTHSFLIEDLSFTYNANQSSAQTSAYCIYFDMDAQTGSGIYNFAVRNCFFDKAYRGIGLNNAVQNTVWGASYERIWFGPSMSGASIAHDPGPAIGQPNISLRDIYIDATTVVAAERILNFIGCESLNVDNVEINNVSNGATGLRLSGGCRFNISNIKIEGATYTGADDYFIEFDNSWGTINYLGLATATINTAGKFSIVRDIGTSGNASYLQINNLYINGTTITSGDAWVVTGGLKTERQSFVIGQLNNGMDGFVLTDVVNYDSANITRVLDWAKSEMSADNGDASITISIGDETIQMFETQLTVNRTVTLPEHELSTSNAFNGLTYKIIRNAATPGTFTLTVQDNDSGALGTLANDTNGAITVMYRRTDWKLIGYETW